MSIQNRGKCYICNKVTDELLCSEHQEIYIWDSSIKMFRLNKQHGSRYITKEYHKTEIILTKILEDEFGKSDVITQVHPIWAVSIKKVLLEFDIYIKSTNTLVEFSGVQHYIYKPGLFHRTIKQFIAQKRRDKRKAKLATKNNYKLIIFSYKEPITKSYVLEKVKFDTFNRS